MTSPEQLTYREWETKSYTGICTVFPSVISLSVLKMSSLSKASAGNQTVKMLPNFKMISPIITHIYFLDVYHTLEEYIYPTEKSQISTQSRKQMSWISKQNV